MRYLIRLISGNKTLWWHKNLGWVANPEDHSSCHFLADVAASIIERNFKALRTEKPNGSRELSLVLWEE